MKSEALKRADAKYRKEKVMRLPIDLYPTDQDIIDHLKTVKSRQGYIKELIRADIKKKTLN